MLEATENTVTNKEEDVNQFYEITVLCKYQYDGEIKGTNNSSIKPDMSPIAFLCRELPAQQGLVRYEEIYAEHFEHEKGENVHDEWQREVEDRINYDGNMYLALDENADMCCEGYDAIAFYDEDGNEIELDKDGVPVKDKVSL